MPSKIEWCDETINPLGWGCFGPGGTKDNPNRCDYCYAHRMAKRNMRDCPECQQFIPHWHHQAIVKPLNWTQPKVIFVQSMGDLFHPSVSDITIRAIIDVALIADQHTYLFLTKNPSRYQEFDFPDNCWLGATNTGIYHKKPDGLIQELGIFASPHPKKFISFEPLLDEYDPMFLFNDNIQWIIIGAMTGPGAKKYQPKKEWVEDLITLADYASIPVLIKENMYTIHPSLPKRKELPW